MKRYDEYLRQCLELAAAYLGMKPKELQAVLDDQNKMFRQYGSDEHRNIARLPRKPVTKAKLVVFLKQYAKDHGTTRGFVKEACREFKIDPKTLRKRMRE